MRILVACESSARVRDAFRLRGHDAYSLDIIPTEGDPKWHLKTPLTKQILAGDWDMIIAFPPCTYLSVVNNRFVRTPGGQILHEQAYRFFMDIVESPCPKVAIENPVGRMSTRYRKPDQIIHPWQFGEPWTKKTCLWLKGLPLLVPTDVVEPVGPWVNGGKYGWGTGLPAEGAGRDSTLRSRTFQGIADAMAAQWG